MLVSIVAVDAMVHQAISNHNANSIVVDPEQFYNDRCQLEHKCKQSFILKKKIPMFS